MLQFVVTTSQITKPQDPGSTKTPNHPLHTYTRAIEKSRSELDENNAIRGFHNTVQYQWYSSYSNDSGRVTRRTVTVGTPAGRTKPETTSTSAIILHLDNWIRSACLLYMLPAVYIIGCSVFPALRCGCGRTWARDLFDFFTTPHLTWLDQIARLSYESTQIIEFEPANIDREMLRPQPQIGSAFQMVQGIKIRTIAGPVRLGGSIFSIFSVVLVQDEPLWWSGWIKVIVHRGFFFREW